MDGNSFGKAMGEAIVMLGIIVAIGGAVVGVTLWSLVPWVWHHLSVAWS